MPSEVSVAKALSGSECLTACLEKLRQVLAKDDRFMSHVAYDGFAASIDFRFYPRMSFVPSVERVVVVAEGEQEGIETDPTITEHIDIPIAPPNKVREDAGLPQPVLVTDAKGETTEKWVKRGPIPRQPPVPHNRVKGI